MRRTWFVVLATVAVSVAGTHPAEATTFVRSKFVLATITEHYSGNDVTSIEGYIKSSREDCRFGRTIMAQYEDLSHNWRIAGFTNASTTDGYFNFSTTGETKITPASLTLFKKRIGRDKFCSSDRISRGPEA